MSRLLYFDCFSGISGDMVLGAFLDAGLPLAELKAALGSLALSECDVTAERVLRAGVSATKFRVLESPHEASLEAQPSRAEGVHDHGHEHHHDHDHQGHAPSTQHLSTQHLGHRTVSEILQLIDRSQLSAPGRHRAKALFERLAEAEAGVHHMPVEKVHLHEVGALDSIIDVVGAVFALEWAGADERSEERRVGKECRL